MYVTSKNMAGLLAFYFWLCRMSMSMYVHLHASELSQDCSLNIHYRHFGIEYHMLTRDK